MLAFHKFTHGNSLVAFGLSAFDVHGLQSSCNVKANVVADFLKAVQDGYLYVCVPKLAAGRVRHASPSVTYQGGELVSQRHPCC